MDVIKRMSLAALALFVGGCGADFFQIPILAVLAYIGALGIVCWPFKTSLREGK